jgi:hypothetical protein
MKGKLVKEMRGTGFMHVYWVINDRKKLVAVFYDKYTDLVDHFIENLFFMKKPEKRQGRAKDIKKPQRFYDANISLEDMDRMDDGSYECPFPLFEHTRGRIDNHPTYTPYYNRRWNGTYSKRPVAWFRYEISRWKVWWYLKMRDRMRGTNDER